MTWDEAIQPLHLPGTNPGAVLLIHGFTSTPGSVADWARGVAEATGFTVEVPLLPGHGTQWSDLNQTRWQDWERVCLEAFDRLKARHPRVFVGGLSLGGALACRTVLRRPEAAALVLVNHLMWLGNPALPLAPLIRRLVPSMPAVAGDLAKPDVVEPAYDRVPTGGVDEFRKLLGQVRPHLGAITAPTLIFKSRQDGVIPLVSATRTLERLGAADKELVWLERSRHVATMDWDLPVLVERTAAFLSRIDRG